MEYENPIIRGFSPDPTICRVDDNFYIVNSSFEFFPGLPVYHSRNLANWELSSYCLTRQSQLRLQHCRESGGIYAPTLRYHNGRFFLAVTNVSDRGNFIIHTEHINGEWSDPVWVAQDGIDPSLLFDDDGTVYFCTASFEEGNTGILMSEIDPFTGEIRKGPVLLTTGCGGRFAEGPHLYKINGLYYLMLAEGGTEYGHTETIMRSRNPYGPYEKCPHNPILSKVDSMLEDIKCTGHADLVEDQNGNWWMVFLAVRPITDASRRVLLHNLGRETFLAPVSWVDGWPVVNGGREVMMRMEGLLPGTPRKRSGGFCDDFSERKPPLEYNCLRNPQIENYCRDWQNRSLLLTGTEVTLSDQDSPTLLMVRQREFDCIAETEVEVRSLAQGGRIGLTAFYNQCYHYEIYVTRSQGIWQVCLGKQIHDLAAVTARAEPESTQRLRFRIVTDRQYYRFYYNCGEREDYIYLGSGDTAGLCTETTRTMTFTGVYLGMFAENGAGSFRRFSVTNMD